MSTVKYTRPRNSTSLRHIPSPLPAVKDAERVCRWGAAEPAMASMCGRKSTAVAPLWYSTSFSIKGA